MPEINFEEVFDYIGGFGAYQKWTYMLLSLVSIYHGIQTVGTVFLGYKQEHWCNVERLQNLPYEMQQHIAIPWDTNSPTEYSKCKMFDLPYDNYTDAELLSWNRTAMTLLANGTTSTCGSYVYNRTVFGSTMQTKYDLVCGGRELWIDMTSSSYMAGMLSGSIVAGYVSDKYGRHKAIVIGSSLAPIFGVAAAFMPYIELYCFMKFMVSTSIFTAYLTATVYVPEIIGSNYRPTAVIFLHIFFSLGGIFLSLISYCVRDFFYLQLVMSIPFICMFPVTWILIESPRWQLTQGYTSEVREALHKIADINNKSLPENVTIKPIKVQSTGKITLLDLLQSNRLRLNLFIACLIWFTVSLVYYGIGLNVGTLAGDIFLNFSLIAFIDIPARLLSTWTSSRYGRRITLIYAFLIGGIASLLSLPLLITDKLDWILVMFSMIGKAGAAVGFSGCYLITAEMFPTQARQASMGTSSAFSRISGIMSPYVGGPLNSLWVGTSAVIFGGFAIVCGLCTFALPETLGKPMPDTIEEAEQLTNKTSGGNENEAFEEEFQKSSL